VQQAISNAPTSLRSALHVWPLPLEGWDDLYSLTILSCLSVSKFHYAFGMRLNFLPSHCWRGPVLILLLAVHIPLAVGIVVDSSERILVRFVWYRSAFSLCFAYIAPFLYTWSGYSAFHVTTGAIITSKPTPRTTDRKALKSARNTAGRHATAIMQSLHQQNDLHATVSVSVCVRGGSEADAWQGSSGNKAALGWGFETRQPSSVQHSRVRQ
jgi:hypothetical protein